MTDGEPSAEAVRAAVETTWRLESAQLIATLARLTGDLGAAEDLAHDALVAALESWPTTGIPQSPGAWLTTTARRRALDALRRAPMLDRAHAEIARDHEAPDAAADLHEALDDPVGDDLLRLVFTTCHPALSTEKSGRYCVAGSSRLIAPASRSAKARVSVNTLLMLAMRTRSVPLMLHQLPCLGTMPRQASK